MGLGYRLRLNKAGGGTYWVYNSGAVGGIPFTGADSNSTNQSGDMGTYLRILSYWTGYCYATVPVDLTNYNTIHFRGKYGTTANSYGGYTFGVAASPRGGYVRSRGHSTTHYQQLTLSDDIDISDLVGPYYIQFQGYDGRRYAEGDTWYQCYAEVTQIWLD